MQEPLLQNIQSPADVKRLSREQLPQLCQELRQLMIETTAKNGGHLASNLGVVELTVALHRIFDSPQDTIVWDVGHQCYAHKILTGRRERFSTLRRKDGLSGFPKPQESVHDSFVTGHSSTSVSAASGMARAKTLKKDPHTTIAVIGDGAFTSGLAYEAINNAARSGDRLIVILNDNKMSISKNESSLARYLSNIRSTPNYFKMKDSVQAACLKLPLVGKPLERGLYKLKSLAKTVLYGSNFFEDLGFRYLGPVDGHDLNQLCSVLSRAKTLDRPIFLHVETQKGKGYSYAEENPGEFHGTSGFDIETGKGKAPSASFSDEFGKYLTEFAAENDKICAITAAMASGTGLDKFAKEYPSRFIDTGIAEG
ncbi:MAG: 1-deoxy-D-xylulose-5-phosphate synthase, partial [Oscillospiraceae bacterium]|nr:1-deoxy-D-xylulose-5-phosphate synthase [Oscillospiraceae bacterium]